MTEKTLSDKSPVADDKPAYQPAPDRMFRRSRRAQMRRRQSARDDSRFFRAIFSLAGVTTAFVFIIVFLATSDGGWGLANLGYIAQPWLGPFSRLEIGGFAIIAILALIFWLRIRKRKP